MDKKIVREYWDRRPCNIRHSSHVVGTKDYFDEVERRKYFVEPHIPDFADFNSWTGKTVLELGCGIGTDAVNFARAGAFYTGIDLSEVSLNLTKLRFLLYGLTGDLMLGDVENPPQMITNKKYDLIYSFGVLHHTPNPNLAIENVRQAMHSDSELRLMLYNRNSYKSAMINAGLDQPEAQSGCPIALTYDDYSVRSLLSGFEILEIRCDHIFPFVVEEYVKYNYVKQPWFDSMPDTVFRALEKQFGWHLLIRAKLS
jgi:2-polyprenyl-3-methyl-5-hydroxy-6-metoxy-1,4-benzoquinol methylase